MPMSFKATGSFKNVESFLERMAKEQMFSNLESYAREGVAALARATPVDSGLTADSWTYEIVNKRGQHQIIFHNTNVVSGVPVAVLIQYGHGTGTGGYVDGRDYINPVILPLFEKIANDVWKAVTK